MLTSPILISTCVLSLCYSGLAYIYQRKFKADPIQNERWWRYGLFSAYVAAACSLVGLLDIQLG